MAKNKVEIDVIVDDKGSTKKLGLESKKAAKGLDDVGTGARTADRNLKGAAQASANGTKNFSKMAQGMGGLVGAYATFAASVFALSAAFNFLKNASDIQVLEQSQVQFAQNSGIAMQSLTGKLRTASKGMLDFQSAASASAMGLAKGFSSDQMAKMADGALRVSNVLGRNFTDSFDRLTRGVSKAEPELLDELGITLRLETAKRKYADSLGISADALTSADQAQAVYLETMTQLDKVVGEQEGKANPFIQLGATFSDLAKTLASFILPPFEALARFMNDNAAVAALFFGAIGVGIAKNMPFVGEAKTAITDFFESQVTKAAAAESALEKYNQEIEETKQAAASLRAEGAKELKSGAGKAVKAGATSPVLARAAAGEMKGPDKTNLKKALASAEKQYAASGKVTKGIFKDVGIDIARSIGGGLAKTEIKAKTTGKRIGGVFKRMELRAKKAGAVIKKKLAGGLMAAGKAAKFMGKAMNMAMKATVILGVIQMIYDLVMALINAPRSIMDGIISVIKGTLKFIQVIVNGAIAAINYVKEQANRIPGVNLKMSEKATFGDDLGKAIEDTIKESSVYKAADTWQTSRESADAYNESLKNVRETAEKLGKELGVITAGKVFNKKDKGYDPLKADRAGAETVKSLPVLDMLRELDTLKGTDKYAEGLAKIKKEMKGLEKISPAFAKAVNEGNTVAVETMSKNAGRFTANIDGAKDKLANMATALKGGGAEAVLSYTSNISRMGDAAIEAGKSLGFTTDIKETLDARFKDSGGIDAFIANLRKIEAEDKRIKDAKNENAISSTNAGSTLNSAFGAREQANLAMKAAELELDQKSNDLQRMKSDRILIIDEIGLAAHTKLMEQGQREIDLQEAKVDAATNAANEIAQMGLKIGDSLQSNMQGAFQSLVDGTKSAKAAFADMAKAIIADIARMIIKMMVMKMLESTLGATGFGKTFLGLGARDGGILTPKGKAPGYSTGGVARGSTSGYPAVLHGTEAVVPLPNGKSIPVEMKGGGATNNNIVVNVSSDGASQKKEGSTGPDMDKLGGAIAVAVQAELQNQKRSGGILNPYGAA
tara:strand:+ start:3696 stop:6890 length:3195 start_codon:yes stop_codon:yes gene_type:complete